MPDLKCPNCGASASLPLGLTCDDHRPVPIRGESDAAVVREALTDERLAEARTIVLPIVGELVAEVDRLRSVLAAADGECVLSPTCVLGTRDE